MSSSSTARVRRLRQHRKGDHSLCLAANCEEAGTVAPGVTPLPATPVTQPAAPAEPAHPAPPGLEKRGRRLWREMHETATLGPADRVLLEEACRIADRLDRLDRILSGSAEDWLGIVETKGDPDRQELVINAPLAETRQQATALRGIVSELRQLGAAGKSQPAPPLRPQASPPVSENPGGDRVPAGVVNFAARIAAKRGNSSAG